MEGADGAVGIRPVSTKCRRRSVSVPRAVLWLARQRMSRRRCGGYEDSADGPLPRDPENRQHWFVRRRPESAASPLHLLRTSPFPHLRASATSTRQFAVTLAIRAPRSGRRRVDVGELVERFELADDDADTELELGRAESVTPRGARVETAAQDWSISGRFPRTARECDFGSSSH